MSEEPEPAMESFRRLAGPPLIFAGWQLMSASFWIGIIIVYVGFGFLLAECIKEPWLIKRPWSYGLQIGLVVVVLGLAEAFTMAVAFVRAPINVSALGIGPVYNLRPGNLDWKSFYNELDVVFVNPTDMPYENFNVLVRPDVPVADIAQIGNLPNVSFRDRYGIVANAYAENPQTHERLKAVILATDAGYNVFCKEIPARGSFQIVMATVGIKPSSHPQVDVPRNGGEIEVPPSIPLQNFYYIQRIPDKLEGDFYYWLGSKENVQLFVPNVTPSNVRVRGSFLGGHRPIHLDEEFSVERMGK